MQPAKATKPQRGYNLALANGGNELLPDFGSQRRRFTNSPLHFRCNESVALREKLGPTSHPDPRGGVPPYLLQHFHFEIDITFRSYVLKGKIDFAFRLDAVRTR